MFDLNKIWNIFFINYKFIDMDYKENWAIWYVNNSYRVEKEIPNRFYQTGPWYDYFGLFSRGHNP